MEKPGKSRIGWPFRIGRALGLVALGILCVSGVHGTANPWESYRLYLQGLLAERAGRLVQAMEVYQKVIDRDPGEGFLQESLAGVALAAGRGDLALVAARQAVLLSTGSAGAYLLLGRVYLARGEHSSAEEAFDQALKLDPSNVEALGWAASRRPLSDPQGARRLFDRFLSSNPEADHVRYGLAEIQERQGDLSAAEASYKKIIQSDPSHREARLGLAALFDVQGDTRAAINAYEEILETETDNVEVLTRLGQLYLLTSQLAEARDLFDRAIVLVPENSGIHFWRALVAQEESQWRDAVRHMEQAAKENPEPGVLLRLASYHGRLDHPKEAIRVLHRLRRTQPENPDFMYYLALAYEEGGNPRAAIRWLNRAVAKNPGNPDFHFHLGLNWDKRKRFDRAETHLLRTIDLEPTHHLALNYLGYSWADRNEHVPEALDLIQRAVSLDPDNTAYRDSLGWAFFRLGRFGEAETALGPVVYQANDPVVWSHYGDVLKALGREREAVRAWQEGLLVGPDDAHLLKRLGVQGRMSHVTPLSAPRTLLKRVEGNFRQVTSLSGVAAVRVRSAGQTLNGQGLFYYARPGLFRVEILGPFFTPQAVLVYDGEVHWSPEVGTPADETAWLALWAEVLSGDFFKRFDDPSVEVHQEGSTLLYVAPGGELRLDAQHKNILEAQRHVPGNAPVRLSFQGSKEIEGIRFPRVVEGQSLTNDFHFALEFSRLTVNPSLKSSLFKPVP
ncbi:MAG: tetratricopeptide repeat protein [Elusimicrobia bacterium]|nr:tetratricopeptide repeat protein [Elusimicrobiota bacterium]